MWVLDEHRFLSQRENTSQEFLHLSQEPFVVDIQAQWHHANVLLRSTIFFIANCWNKKKVVWIKCSEVTNTNTSYEKFHKIIKWKTLPRAKTRTISKQKNYLATENTILALY